MDGFEDGDLQMGELKTGKAETTHPIEKLAYSINEIFNKLDRLDRDSKRLAIDNADLRETLENITDLIDDNKTPYAWRAPDWDSHRLAVIRAMCQKGLE